ncbi:unnamed protein product [Didymodactylos carnosus]|uniref:Tesmin/TSO1-like CXC domain-containing protein n=1 Tax=Didymodactylos carnosus TaxID=1234261 RepID=A0A815CSC5_9BILA|nr:unnamed protein product [Didymodactylos carnosus]CAF4091886.1 unnamed protein product [Didymodactylos carnosus]
MHNEIIKFEENPLKHETISAAEQLLLACYSNKSSSKYSAPQYQTLDELRAAAALNGIKQHKKNIAATLPPTSDAFYYHCLRAFRQIYIWTKAFEQFIVYPSLENNGYELINGQTLIKWKAKSSIPDDISLSSCGKCTTGCKQCKCGLNKLKCTIYCRCDPVRCENRSDKYMAKEVFVDDQSEDDEFSVNIANFGSKEEQAEAEENFLEDINNLSDFEDDLIDKPKYTYITPFPQHHSSVELPLDESCLAESRYLFNHTTDHDYFTQNVSFSAKFENDFERKQSSMQYYSSNTAVTDMNDDNSNTNFFTQTSPTNPRKRSAKYSSRLDILNESFD